jgi:hypothetical protein
VSVFQAWKTYCPGLSGILFRWIPAASPIARSLLHSKTITAVTSADHSSQFAAWPSFGFLHSLMERHHLGDPVTSGLEDLHDDVRRYFDHERADSLESVLPPHENGPEPAVSNDRDIDQPAESGPASLEAGLPGASFPKTASINAVPASTSDQDNTSQTGDSKGFREGTSGSRCDYMAPYLDTHWPAIGVGQSTLCHLEHLRFARRSGGLERRPGHGMEFSTFGLSQHHHGACELRNKIRRHARGSSGLVNQGPQWNDRGQAS